MARTLADERKYCEDMIEALSATLEGRAGSDITQYQVGGQLITKMPVKDLIYYRGYFTSRLQQIKQRERAQKGQATGRLIRCKF